MRRSYANFTYGPPPRDLVVLADARFKIFFADDATKWIAKRFSNNWRGFTCVVLVGYSFSPFGTQKF